jgi:hypothetical protein
MANSFTVNLIKAKSEVPLHLYGTSSVATTAQYRDLWRPAGPIADSFVAFDLGRLRTNASTIVNLRLTCTFGQNFVEKSGLVVEGFLDNTSAMKSPVTVTDTEQIIVQSFVMANRRLYPVSYKGEFEWKLMDGSTVAATFATKTPLELYTIVPFTTDESTIQWTASGVSVNLLRRYLVPWRAGLQGLGDFYSYAAGAIFQSPFVYNNVDGNYRYLEMPGDTPFGEMNDPDKLTIFKLGEYFRELEQAEREEGTTYRVNCRDMAGIVQIVLSLLLPKRSKGYHIRMQPFGYIKTTK